MIVLILYINFIKPFLDKKKSIFEEYGAFDVFLACKIDHEIFSPVILSLMPIQEGKLSVSGERIWTHSG